MKNNNKTFMLFFLSALIVLVAAIIISVLMVNTADVIEKEEYDKMKSHAFAASLLATADELDEYMTVEDMSKEGYSKLRERLIDFNSKAGLEYTYFLRLDTDTNMMQFVMDNSPEEVAEGLAAEQVGREEWPDKALEGETIAVPLGWYSDGWEGLLTAYSPVYYADGRISNILAGVDVQDIYIKKSQNTVIALTVVLIVSLALVFIISFTCLMLYRKKAQQAEAASESKTSFLSNMSHEMRTPMNAIIGMTEIAKGTDDDKRIEYCLDKIDEAAQHLLGVINDVLDISKIEAGKLTLIEEDVSLDKLLQRITTVVGYRIDERDQSFIIKVDKDVPDKITTDGQRLSQVITNLLSNAVKFTGEKGTIKLLVRLVEQSREGIVLGFDVIDNGIGISAEQQKKLFSSFEQADNTISRRFGGTGLGLAISKTIVECMGGSIGIESEIGEGSRFFFTVKVKPGHSIEEFKLPETIDISSLRVLAIDDNNDVLEYFTYICDKLGVSCDTACSKQEALDLLDAESSYQVIFIDYILSDTDGISLTRTIREKYGEHAVVIMISATQWQNIEEEAREAGVNRFLPKPLFVSAVADSITGILGSGQVGSCSGDDENMGLFAGKRVLLAEDVDINREILCALLEETQIVVDCAENGKIAVDMVAASPELYDLILMDIHMPEMDGYTATRTIRSIPAAKDIPIIAMTANVFKEDIEKCLDAGMNDHIGKPVDVDIVIDKLKRYILD